MGYARVTNLSSPHKRIGREPRDRIGIAVSRGRNADETWTNRSCVGSPGVPAGDGPKTAIDSRWFDVASRSNTPLESRVSPRGLVGVDLLAPASFHLLTSLPPLRETGHETLADELGDAVAPQRRRRRQTSRRHLPSRRSKTVCLDSALISCSSR